MSMIKTVCLGLLASLATMAAAAPTTAQEQQKLNIILIVTDDFGYGDAGVNGGARLVRHESCAEASFGDRENAATSGGLVPAKACADLFKAFFQAILDDLRRLAGRLPGDRRALLRSLDGYFENFLTNSVCRARLS